MSENVKMANFGGVYFLTFFQKTNRLGAILLIGVTKNTFKERWDGHNFDAQHIGSRHWTTLANHILASKENNIPFEQTWAWESNARSYSPEVGHCDACRVENSPSVGI